MRGGPRLWVWVGVLVTLFLHVRPAHACEGGEEEGKRIATAAFERMQSGDAAGAEPQFHDALSCYESPVIRFFLARSLEEQNKLIAAEVQFERACQFPLDAASPEGWIEQKAAACRKRKDVIDAIPKLTIIVKGASVDGLRLDGELVEVGEQSADPGEHRVVAVADGRELSEVVTLERGGAAEVVLDFAAMPDAQPEPDPPDDGGPGPSGLMVGGAVAVGLGGAALIAWAALGGVFISNHAELGDNCDDAGRCSDPADLALAEETETLGNAATAMLVIGVVAAAAGVTLLVLDAGDDADVSAAFVATPTGARLDLRF